MSGDWCPRCNGPVELGLRRGESPMCAGCQVRQLERDLDRRVESARVEGIRIGFEAARERSKRRDTLQGMVWVDTGTKYFTLEDFLKERAKEERK